MATATPARVGARSGRVHTSRAPPLRRTGRSRASATAPIRTRTRSSRRSSGNDFYASRTARTSRAPFRSSNSRDGGGVQPGIELPRLLHVSWDASGNRNFLAVTNSSEYGELTPFLDCRWCQPAPAGSGGRSPPPPSVSSSDLERGVRRGDPRAPPRDRRPEGGRHGLADRGRLAHGPGGQRPGVSRRAVRLRLRPIQALATAMSRSAPPAPSRRSPEEPGKDSPARTADQELAFANASESVHAILQARAGSPRPHGAAEPADCARRPVGRHRRAPGAGREGDQRRQARLRSHPAGRAAARRAVSAGRSRAIQRSASSAAMQPVPAAVTAWR